MMEVTRVEIELAKANKLLRAYAKITLDDCFVVHGIRLIEKGGHLIACMPNRKRWLDCVACHVGVAVLDDYCGRCGVRQPPTNARLEQVRYELGLDDDDDRVRPFLDVCHPITPSCRAMIDQAVVAEYRRAVADGPPQAGTDGHDA